MLNSASPNSAITTPSNRRRRSIASTMRAISSSWYTATATWWGLDAGGSFEIRVLVTTTPMAPLTGAASRPMPRSLSSARS
jgi:hypothetical protein